MSSGQKVVQINHGERLVSDDTNKMQSFIGNHVAQALRRLTQKYGTAYAPLEFPGLAVERTTAPTGTFGTVHDVFGGLMVRPDNSSFLLVDPGSAGFYCPTYPGLTSDDSPYIVVDDPGVTSVSVLTFTANASGSPRIDVVECRPVAAAPVQENRDVYDPATGNWVPTLVTKVASAKLEYRIRLGTANAGFPALDPEWCPLAFCVVQSGASGFLQSDFYDVRPLVSERDSRTSPWVSTDGSQAVFQECIVDHRSVVSENITNHAYRGWVSGSFQGYKFGGYVERNVASSLADFGLNTAGGGQFNAVEYRNAENHITSGSTAVNNTLGFSHCLVAVFPAGLGRCVRYTQNTTPTITGPVVTAPQVGVAGRLPKGFNGILVIGRPINVGPMRGCLMNNLPASFGTAIAGNFVSAVVTWLASNGTNLDPYDANGKTITRMKLGGWPGKQFTNSALPSTTATSTLACVPLNGNIDWATNPHQYPTTATKVRYSFVIGTGYSAAPTLAYHQTVTAEPSNSVGNPLVVGGRETALFTGTVSASNGMVLDFPVPGKDWPQVGGGPGFTLSVASVSSGSNIVSIAASVDLLSWDEY
jgi:hypothetical protein